MATMQGRFPLSDSPEERWGLAGEVTASVVQTTTGNSDTTAAIMNELSRPQVSRQKILGIPIGKVKGVDRSRSEVGQIRRPDLLEPKGVELAYPRILSDDNDLRMSVEEFKEELTVVASSGWPEDMNEPYLYSLTVTAPDGYRVAADLERYEPLLEGTALEELEVGHVGREVFYRLSEAGALAELLQELLSGVEEVQVTLQTPSQYKHLRVFISA